MSFVTQADQGSADIGEILVKVRISDFYHDVNKLLRQKYFFVSLKIM